jgi:hypothetical protein
MMRWPIFLRSASILPGAALAGAVYFPGDSDRPSLLAGADSGKFLFAPVTELPPHSWLCM